MTTKMPRKDSDRGSSKSVFNLPYGSVILDFGSKDLKSERYLFYGSTTPKISGSLFWSYYETSPSITICRFLFLSLTDSVFVRYVRERSFETGRNKINYFSLGKFLYASQLSQKITPLSPTVGAESLCRNTCISYFRHLELRQEANFFTAYHLCVLEQEENFKSH